MPFDHIRASLLVSPVVKYNEKIGRGFQLKINPQPKKAISFGWNIRKRLAAYNAAVNKHSNAGRLQCNKCNQNDMCPELELQYNNTITLIDQVGIYVWASVHPTWNRSQAQGICPSGDFADVTLTPPHPRGAGFVGASVCCIWTISNTMNCICSCCIEQNITWTNQRLKLRSKLKKSIHCLSCTSWTFTLKVTRFFYLSIFKFDKYADFDNFHFIYCNIYW